jgi:hypothetical protein
VRLAKCLLVRAQFSLSVRHAPHRSSDHRAAATPTTPCAPWGRWGTAAGGAAFDSGWTSSYTREPTLLRQPGTGPPLVRTIAVVRGGDEGNCVDARERWWIAVRGFGPGRRHSARSRATRQRGWSRLPCAPPLPRSRAWSSGKAKGPPTLHCHPRQGCTTHAQCAEYVCIA